jgi:peptide/nickel transport system substrate-binding protein
MRTLSAGWGAGREGEVPMPTFAGSRTTGRSFVALLVLLVLGTACTGSHDESRLRARIARPTGGTLRVGVLTDQSGLSCEFTLCGGQHDDPQWSGEDPMYYELSRCCLLRTLLSYNGEPTSGGGTVLRPDVATALPTISTDGLTWTFNLKHGLHYAPPLQLTEITAQDFIRSLDRLLGPPPSNGPDYYGGVLDPYVGNYLDLRDLIVGASDYVDGKATGITGLEAPDRYTLRVHLTRVDGALGSILSEPDAAPIPPNPSDPSAPFGVLQGHGRPGWGYVVARGPYMIEGADRLGFSKPPDQELPASGDAPNSLALVRNPSWDPRADRLRAARPDRIVLTPVANEDDALALIRGGALDLVFNWDAKPDLLTPGGAGPRTHIVTSSRDSIVFLDLNVAVRPFDDVHVRTAINLAIDREAVANADVKGGAEGAVPATHIGLDSEEDNLLLNYDPFHSRGGNPQAAKAQMAASSYDHDRDGVCDASACRGIPLIVRADRAGEIAAARLVSRELRVIGLEVRVAPQDSGTFFDSFGRPEAHVAFRLGEWIKDLTDGATYFPQLFAGPAVGVGHSYPSVLLGAPPRLLKKWGYSVRSVPNVDDRVEQCLPLSFGDAAGCWARLDQYLMSNVLARVPLFSVTTGRVIPAGVSGVTFDQSDAEPMPSLDRIVVNDTPPSTSPQPRLAVPGIPDGVYRFTITKADLLRFDPHTDPNGLDENTGTTTVYLRGGRFEFIENADHPVYSPIATGYAGSGDRVVFDLLEPSSNALSTPSMRWTFDGHALQFTFLGCGNLNHLDPSAPHLCDDVRAVYEAHPWEKVG